TAGEEHTDGWSRILYTTATNGGGTWSDPVVVSKQSADGISAILPAIAVASDGTVAITYYDFTGLTPDNTTTLPTTIWSTKDFGQSRTKVAGPFNFLAAPNAGGAFLGDYQGLAADGTSFVGVNDIPNCNNAAAGASP